MSLDGFSRVSASPYFEVFEHPEHQVVLAKRTPTLDLGSDQLQCIVWALESLLEPHNAGWGLIVDTRAVAGNSDPRLEQKLIEWSRRAVLHFMRLTILVRTTAGAAQATRHIGHASNALVTSDEALASAWARALD